MTISAPQLPWNPGVVPPTMRPRSADSSATPSTFLPPEPQSLADAGLSKSMIEALVLKFLLSHGPSTGRQIAAQLRLPFGWLQPLLIEFKSEMLLGFKDSALMSDYVFELSDRGLEKSRRHLAHSTYFGAAPVSLDDYVTGIREQSIRRSQPRLADMKKALGDLILPDMVLSQVGQAMNQGRGLFLYGKPGNGKTSIAERVIRSISPYAWIERTLMVTGEILWQFDPRTHKEAQLVSDSSLLESQKYDRRWVRIRRPTVIAGGELTLSQLDFSGNAQTGVVESPLQLKSNGGAFVVDDFGRQRAGNEELLNRWIIPLEKGYDYLTLPSGRQVQVPFDQMLVFATNLRPQDIVDEAFLRRIPHKIEVKNPGEGEFRGLLARTARQLELSCAQKAIEYLIHKHYLSAGREFRFCHPRDLLTHVKNFCQFHELPSEVTPKNLDIAVHNYFAGL